MIGPPSTIYALQGTEDREQPVMGLIGTALERPSPAAGSLTPLRG